MENVWNSPKCFQEGLKAYTLEQIDASETLQKVHLDQSSKKNALDALRKELE